MSLEIEGKIIRKLNVQTGVSQRGNWSKQEFIIEYQEGSYPSQACFNVWGEDKVKDLERFQIGDSVKVSFNVSSREYNGRWYTNIRGWKSEPADAQQMQQPAAPAPQAAPAPTATPDFLASDSSDDLPF